MKNLWISIKITLAMCVVLFVGYVLVLRLVAWVASPNDGEAPVVTYNGKVVGAANVGQVFTDSVYFWGRPSNVDYNGGGSGGSNKGTNNPEYLAQVEERAGRLWLVWRFDQAGVPVIPVHSGNGAGHTRGAKTAHRPEGGKDHVRFDHKGAPGPV